MENQWTIDENRYIEGLDLQFQVHPCSSNISHFSARLPNECSYRFYCFRGIGGILAEITVQAVSSGIQGTRELISQHETGSGLDHTRSHTVTYSSIPRLKQISIGSHC